MGRRGTGSGAAGFPGCSGAVRLVWLAFALLLVACSRPPVVTVRGEGWVADLSWSPGRLRALQPARLSLKVHRADGSPADVGGMKARADMPEMSHDPEPVRFRRTGPGSYEAEHVFSMDGRWRVQVRGDVAGTWMDARFELVVGSP